MYTVVTFFISGSPLRGESTVNRLNGTRDLLLRSNSGLCNTCRRAEILVDLDFQPYVIPILDDATLGKEISRF